MDDRPYKDIFQNGFTPRVAEKHNTLKMIKDHVQLIGKGWHKNFVSTTTSDDTVKHSSFKSRGPNSDNPIYHQYFVLKNLTGWNAKDFPEISNTSSYRSLAGENEVITTGVPKEHIEKVLIWYWNGHKEEIENEHFSQ